MTVKLTSGSSRRNPRFSEISNASKAAWSVSLLLVSICSALYSTAVVRLREGKHTVSDTQLVNVLWACFIVPTSFFFFTPSTKSQSNFLYCNVVSSSVPVSVYGLYIKIENWEKELSIQSKTENLPILYSMQYKGNLHIFGIWKKLKIIASGENWKY